MTENVAQWLAEIQSLQQQVAELKKEREQAYDSVDNWRNAYDAEAQQRRRDIELYRARIAELQQAAPDVSMEIGPVEIGGGVSAIEIAIIKAEQSVEQLQTRLIAAMQECDRLKADLQAEAAEHINTRESLTAALGDAVDLLSKARPETNFQATKTPSP